MPLFLGRQWILGYTKPDKEMKDISFNIDNYKRIILIVFFSAILFTGLFTYKDYGIAGDELISRNNGVISYKYVTEGDKELFSYKDRYYGTTFEIFLVFLEDVAGFSDTQDVFRLRHIVTFLLFFIGVIFFYLLASRSSGSWKYGLLGSVFLVLSPRIFAHAFFNSKDVGFMSVFIIAAYTLIRFLDDKTMLRALLHAFTCAILVDIRIMGIFLPAVTVFFFTLDFLLRDEKRKGEALLSVFVYIWAFFVLMVLFWPVLWENTFQNFISAFKQMKSFPWDGYMLYMGEYERSIALPWHYIPVWILITTPVLYSVFFFTGLSGIVFSFLKSPIKAFRDKHCGIIFLTLFILPLASVIALRAVLYDGWRHMFFLYPPFLLIAVLGIRSIMTFSRRVLKGKLFSLFRLFIGVVIFFSVLSPLYFMVRWHPYQNVYFNFLSGGMDGVRWKYEMDYWGISYKEVIEYIVENDNREKITVYISSLEGMRGWIPALILDKEERERLSFTGNAAEADYIVSNYRWHLEDFTEGEEIYSVNVSGAKIATLRKK